MARYFAATIMGGRLFVESIPDWGDWDNRRLHYESDHMVTQLLLGLSIDRKADTAEELTRLVDNTPGLPAVRVWISGGTRRSSASVLGGPISSTHVMI